MAMVLICLLIFYFRQTPKVLPLAIVLLLMTMVWPKVFKPLAVLWFGLSNVMGTVVSKILLTVIFFLVVTPVGLLRRIFGADPMQTGKWKKDTGSLLKVRNKTFQACDLEHPY